MASVLIAVIYLAFVSMGLPDALLGAAWPSIQASWGLPVSWAGIVTFLIAGGTVISSMASNRLIQRFGTGWVTAGSTALVTLALFGFSFAGAFWQLCLLALPYGLGAGSIDAALNNYVALHYKSRQMSWIHFFWGVGATAGPDHYGLVPDRRCGMEQRLSHHRLRPVGHDRRIGADAPAVAKEPRRAGQGCGQNARYRAGSPAPSRRKGCADGVLLLLRAGIHRGFVGQQLYGCHSRRRRGKGRQLGLGVLSGHHGGAIPVRLYCRSFRRSYYGAHGPGAGGGGCCFDAAAPAGAGRFRGAAAGGAGLCTYLPLLAASNAEKLRRGKTLRR